MASELALAIRDVTRALDAYLLYDAASRLVDLVDALSNWYVRRSRARFWAPVGGDDATSLDKRDAYHTLYDVLVAIAKLAAPFIPFFAEELYQTLVRGPFPEAAESVHLSAYPEADVAAIDEALARDMRAVRELVSLGLQVRTANKLKVRQPLERADMVIGSRGVGEALAAHVDLMKEELNVLEVRFLEPGQEGEAVRYVLKPNFRALGPKLGKKVQLAKQVLAKADAGALRAELASAGKVTVDLEGEAVELGPDEIEVAVEAAEGFAAAGGRAGVVVLHTTLTDTLRDAGLVREIISRVQGLRKELGLGFTDRVRIAIEGSERLQRVVGASSAEIAREALATAIDLGPATFEGERRESSVDGEALVLVMRKHV